MNRFDIAVDVTMDGRTVRITRSDLSRPELALVGRVDGSDDMSIRWEIPPPSPYAGEVVSVQASPTRIYFTLPTLFQPTSQRFNNFFEYELRR